MGKYDDIIAEGKIMLTDVGVSIINIDSDSCIKIREYISSLSEGIFLLEESEKESFLTRFKKAMFVTEENEQLEKTAENTQLAIQQLKFCLRCKCGSCPLIDDRCKCKGCVYGAYVSNCPGGEGIETRSIDINFPVLLNNMPVKKLEFDRKTRKTIATTLNNNDIEMKYKLNLETGENSLL